MVETPSTSKLRSAASQLCAAFPYFLLSMSFGSSSGFQTILIAELYKDNSEITTTVDQLSWFAGLDMLNVVGLTIGGISTQRFGTRATALFTNLLYISSWLLYYYSTNISIVLLARAISASTSTVSLAYPYVSEISEPHLRGIFLGIAQMAAASGIFISWLLGSFMYWRTIALVNLSVPIVTALTVLLVPNSPIWLANRGYLNEAEKALCSVRGWGQPYQVEIEFQNLVESVQKSKSSANGQSITGRYRGFYEIFLQRPFYLPLATMCLFFFMVILSGGPLIDSYATIMFQKINSPIEESLATAIMGATSIIGKTIIIVFFNRVGKRKFIFSSTVVVSLCLALIATIGLLKLMDVYYLWISSIAFIISNLADVLGASSIVYMIVGEIFPSDVRYIASSISFSFSSIVQSIGKIMFLYVVEAVTLPVVFGLFAFGNAIAFVTYFLLMPETEGKSLQEIEDRFECVEKIDRDKCSNVSSM